MAKRGRPSKYTKAIVDEILQRLAAGKSLRGICVLEDMPAESTVRGWNVDNVEGFSARYARARRECAYSRLDIAHDTLLEKEAMFYTDEGGNHRVDTGSVNLAKAYADYVRWEASKLIPEMADKMDLNHAGKITLTLAELTRQMEGDK